MLIFKTENKKKERNQTEKIQNTSKINSTLERLQFAFDFTPFSPFGAALRWDENTFSVVVERISTRRGKWRGKKQKQLIETRSALPRGWIISSCSWNIDSHTFSSCPNYAWLVPIPSREWSDKEKNSLCKIPPLHSSSIIESHLHQVEAHRDERHSQQQINWTENEWNFHLHDADVFCWGRVELQL